MDNPGHLVERESLRRGGEFAGEGEDGNGLSRRMGRFRGQFRFPACRRTAAHMLSGRRQAPRRVQMCKLLNLVDGREAER